MIRVFLFSLFVLALFGIYTYFTITSQIILANYVNYGILTSICLYSAFYLTYYKLQKVHYISESFIVLFVISCLCFIRDYLVNHNYLLYALCVYFPVYLILGTIHLEKFKKLSPKKADFLNFIILFCQYTTILLLLFGLYDVFQENIALIIATNIYACIINYALLMTTLKLIYIRNINYLFNYISVFFMLIADILFLYDSIFSNRLAIFIIQNIIRWTAIFINIYGIHLIIKN